jgi:putative membrane protein
MESVMKIAMAAACVVVLGACGIDDREKSSEPVKTSPFAQSVQPIDPPAATATGHAEKARSYEITDFIAKAGMRGLVEVKTGNLVLDKGTDADVRNFAWRMVSDYSSMNRQLAQLAAAKGLTLPTELRGEHKLEFDRLSKLSGDAFDRSYLYHVENTLLPSLRTLERASTSADDADVKAFASRTLSMFRDHETLAKQTAKALQREKKRVITIE